MAEARQPGATLQKEGKSAEAEKLMEYAQEFARKFQGQNSQHRADSQEDLRHELQQVQRELREVREQLRELREQQQNRGERN